MDAETLKFYVDKTVKINLEIDFYYKGLVMNVTTDTLTLRDIRDRLVSISCKSISEIKEVAE